MKKTIPYLTAATLLACHSLALAAPKNQAEAAPPPPPAPVILSIGVAKSGVASVAWFVDVGANQAIRCDAVGKSCTRMVIPQNPASPSKYIPLGTETYGSGTGAWLLDTSNNQAIICVHNPVLNECSRMAYWP